MSHGELLDAIQENHELCSRALTQLQEPTPVAPPGEVTQADITFLESWLKARNLVIGGLQLLQLADPDNAASIQHEVECTETAFTLLPGVLKEMRHHLD
jgi:hypothetical protein